MTVKHDFVYNHQGRGWYELDQASVDSAPEEFIDLRLPGIIIAGSQIAFGGRVHSHISRKRKFVYLDSEKHTKPKVHTVITVGLR